jgi:hypothetical protein
VAFQFLPQLNSIELFTTLVSAIYYFAVSLNPEKITATLTSEYWSLCQIIFHQLSLISISAYWNIDGKIIQWRIVRQTILTNGRQFVLGKTLHGSHLPSCVNFAEKKTKYHPRYKQYHNQYQPVIFARRFLDSHKTTPYLNLSNQIVIDIYKFIAWRLAWRLASTTRIVWRRNYQKVKKAKYIYMLSNQ